MMLRLLLILSALLTWVDTGYAAIKVNDSGTWKTPTSVSVNDNGTWKSPVAVSVNDNGTWKMVGLTDGQQYVFSWEMTDDTGVTGYNFYLNGALLCSSSTPADRTLTCTSSVEVPSTAVFTMTMTTGAGESNPSNSITYTVN